MNPKPPLLQKSLLYLKSLPNLEVVIQGEPYLTDEVLADGHLTITNASRTVDYLCEIQTGLTDDSVEQTVEYFANLGNSLKPEQRPLLIIRHLSDLIIDRFLERSIEFIDVEGHIYLNSRTIFILVRHHAAKVSTDKSLEITAEALQVIYTLLEQPNLLLEASHEPIANICDLPQKTVSNTLSLLQGLRYIEATDVGYEIVDYVKLLERWELGYSETLRSKLLLGRFKPVGKQNFSEVETQISELASQCGYEIGGEMGAAIVTQNLRPLGATLHLGKNSDARQIAVKLKLKPDPEGSIILLRNFGHDDGRKDEFEGDEKNLVSRLLIHAELVHNSDSRLRKTTQLVYKQLRNRVDE